MPLVAQEIPKVGLVMEEVKVVRWLKNVGDSLAAGEPLLEVETEKSVVEIEAAATGRLTQILVQADERGGCRRSGGLDRVCRAAGCECGHGGCAHGRSQDRRADTLRGRHGGARRRAYPKYSGRPQTRC